jgi:predicted trehalose synthase
VGDGPKTFDEFKVDLQQLHNAIGTVKREHGAITDSMSGVSTEFAAVKDAWDTPSAATYDDVRAWFVRVSGDLEDLLNDMVGRMQTAYNNYKQAEEANIGNLTPHGDR